MEANRQTHMQWAPKLPDKPSWGARNIPVAFFVSYLSLTVVIFAVGPWPWPVSNSLELYAFLIAAHVALFLGYVTAPRRAVAPYSGAWSAERLVRASALITLLLFLPTLAYRTGSMVPNVFASVADLGEAYLRSGEIRRGEATPIIEYVRFLAGPFLYLTLPLAVFFWTSLRKGTKLLAVGATASTLLMFIAMGTNKAIADTVLLIPCMLAAAHFSGRQRLRITGAVVWSVAAGGAFALFLAFFTATQTARPGSTGYYGYSRAAGVSADYDNIMVRSLSPAAQVGVVSLASYLGQGYYATSLALEEPWVPTWGVGNSFFTLRQAERIVGPSIEDDPYPMRIESRGWDAYGLFSSIYPWIASDVSFPGAIVVVFMIGRLLARTWRESLSSLNPFAVGVLAHLCIMLFYFPANNQVLQSGEGFSAFWGTFIAWRLTRRRLRPAHTIKRW